MKTRRGRDPRSKVVRALDAITPKIVKLRDGRKCQRCGSMPSKQGCHWAHIYGRRDFRLRWDLLNALTLCYGCHSWFDSNARDAHDWFEDQWPARAMHIDAVRRSPQQGTIRTARLEELLESHRKKYRELTRN